MKYLSYKNLQACKLEDAAQWCCNTNCYYIAITIQTSNTQLF